MASSKETLGFQADDDLAERFHDWRRRRGYENKSEALQDAVQIAMRESSSPIVYRLKDKAISWAADLALVAFVIVVLGYTIPVLEFRAAVEAGLIVVSAAFLLLSGLEVVRLFGGSNELGEALRRRFA